MDAQPARQDAGHLRRSIGVRAAAAVVVANIIGAGIFTTTGFQAADLGDPMPIYLLWILGGVLALCGALCYGELGAAIPKAGAEYQYLHEAFGGRVALMSVIVSLTAGFSAPIAAAAKGLSHYLSYYIPPLGAETHVLPGITPGDAFALGVVWMLVLIHTLRTEVGIGFTAIWTVAKVVGIVVLVTGAAALGGGDVGNLTRSMPLSADGSGTAAAMATSLVFVMFCYSGWNSAAYLSEEIRDPGRNLPRALLWGTGCAAVLYLALNLFYFYGAGVEGLAGRVEVAQVAASGLFGPRSVGFVTVLAAVSLLAACSAMTAVGPRVYYACGRDFPGLRGLSRLHPKTRTPAIALLTQGLITSLFIVAGAVDQIQHYAGFTLAGFSTLAVISVIVLRRTQPDLQRPFKVPLYPATPILFIVVSIWMMLWSFEGRPTESTLGLLTVVLGGAAYPFLIRPRRTEIEG